MSRGLTSYFAHSLYVHSKEVKSVNIDHKDGDPDKTQDEYDRDNHSDQENPNNAEYDK